MAQHSGQRIFLVGNDLAAVLNFRKDWIGFVQEQGYAVTVLAPCSDSFALEQLKILGCAYLPIPLSPRGFNPLKDLYLLWILRKRLHEYSPDVLICYTIKPVIWGGLAARWIRHSNSHAMITGLGYTFIDADSVKKKWLSSVVRWLYKRALKGHRKVFFQNADDRALFTQAGFVEFSKTRITAGSGVNLFRFSYSPVTVEGTAIVFLLIARLLKEKGIYEFVEAARRVKSKYPSAQFHMVGWIESDNPGSIKAQDLESWINAGVIEYLGKQADVRPFIHACSVYVLPSYREGTPRSVLEAMAIGRAIITTDAPGCRDTVVQGENGFLVPLKDIECLAEAMVQFIREPDLIAKMGQKSRWIAEQKYDVCQVNQMIFDEIGFTVKAR